MIATIRMRSFGLLSVLTLSATAAIESRSPYAVKGSHPVPRGWEAVHRAPASHPIELRIGLKQDRFGDLERQLYEVSDPSHPDYGKHMSAEDVNELVKPSDESLELVHEWLEEHGIAADNLRYTPAKDWIKINLPVEKVEEMLNTEYFSWVRDDGLTAVRTPEWSLPMHLHDHISTIQPTNSFFGPRRAIPLERRMSSVIAEPAIPEADIPKTAAAGGDAAAVCDVNLVTPTCIRTLYGTLNYTAQGNTKMALNDFLGEVNLRADAHLMLEAYRPEAAEAAYQFEQVSIAGGTLQQTPLNATQLAAGTGLEGALDVQSMLSIAWPLPLVAYSTGGSPDYIPDLFTPTDSNEPYLTWLEYILALPDPLPSVVSTSYDDDEQTVPQDYAVQVCNLLAQLGARGTTALFDSGDNGIGQDGYCVSNDGTDTPTFLPNFPSTCPYVISVGGTYKVNPEVAVFRNRTGKALYTAGGGFSNYFPRPSYQDAWVPKYISDVVDPLGYDGQFNPEGRGYPDIAAQSLNYSVYWNFTLTPVSGTSMSTPIAASILALVNDALVGAGKSTLGFMNPWLYSEGYKGFTDILSGYAAGCNTTSGLPAAEGWDAVTGLGTPNFGEILALKGVESGKGGWSDWKE